MRALVPGLLLALGVGCGTPSRHLTTRVVDDPMVLPRRMLALGLGGQVSHRQDTELDRQVTGVLQYGLGKRLELDGLMALRWAILDDAPSSEVDRLPDRLSLAVRGGAMGIGASSTEGLIVLPVAGVEVRKRLGAEARVSLSAVWQGKWVESPAGWGGLYQADLWPASSRTSSVEVAADVRRQLGDHVALGVGASVHQLQRCTLPSCDWSARGGELWLGPQVRPRRWLTLALRVFGGGRYRPVGQPVQSPDERIYELPGAVSWLGTSASVTFQW